jgi:hypothetical protein
MTIGDADYSDDELSMISWINPVSSSYSNQSASTWSFGILAGLPDDS